MRRCVFNPAFTTYRMHSTADGYLTRVATTWSISSKIAQPIVIAAAGLAAATLGARTALVALAAILLASVVLLPWKAWRTPLRATATNPTSKEAPLAEPHPGRAARPDRLGEPGGRW